MLAKKEVYGNKVETNFLSGNMEGIFLGEQEGKPVKAPNFIGDKMPTCFSVKRSKLESHGGEGLEPIEKKGCFHIFSLSELKSGLK